MIAYILTWWEQKQLAHWLVMFHVFMQRSAYFTGLESAEPHQPTVLHVVTRLSWSGH